MIVSIILFMIGRSQYKIREPEGNVFSEFCSISWNAIRNRRKGKQNFFPRCTLIFYAASREEKKSSESWLDFAKGNPRWSDRKVEDIKFVYPVAVVFLPLPFFWALFDMQGSRFEFSGSNKSMFAFRWTLTAAQCNGYIFGDNTDSFMLPDHAQMINPILILILIPIFQVNIIFRPKARAYSSLSIPVSTEVVAA
jgi:solute carrier family 15 oligopeptide transporter 1